MAKTVDPKQYQIYVNRQGANYIDYQKITERANKLLTDEVDRRENIKQDLDNRANDLYDQLGTVQMNSDSKFSDQVLDAAAQLKKSLMADQKLLKSGAISVNEYKQQLERAKSQMGEWGAITKSFGEYKDNYNQRIKLDDDTGEMIMAPDELIIKESSLGFSYTYDKQIYVDPVTKNTYYYQPNEDGSIPDFNKESDKFMAMSNARNRFQYENDRKAYDIGFQVKQEKEMLGTIVDSYVGRFKGANRVGTYVMTETDYTVLEQEGLLDQFVDTIYAKTSGTDRGLANSADVMGEFTVALSLEQFKKNCKGGEFCDEKYFIKVNPNDPSGMQFEFSDKAFVEERVKADIKEKANMQLGRKEEISSKAYDPNEDISATAQGDKDSAVAGFFEDYKSLLSGDQDKFNAAEKDLRNRANARLVSEKSDVQVNKISRTDKEMIIEFVNEDGTLTTEKISLFKGGDLNKPRADKEVYQELFGFLRPDGYDAGSFQSLSDQALRGGFDYTVKEGEDNRGTAVESQKGFKEVTVNPLSKQKVLSEDGKTFPDYSAEWQRKADKEIKGGDYEDSLNYFKANLGTEIKEELKKIGIMDNIGDVVVTGVNESGPTNSFTIKVTDPYTQKPLSATFKFDTPAKNTSSVVSAMDKIISEITFIYNNSEGGKQIKDKEEKKSAPTS